MRIRTLVLGSLLALGLCAWCGWASGLHHSTIPAFAAWSASLAAVVVIGLLLRSGHRHPTIAFHLAPATESWPRPGQRGRGRAFIGISPWLILILIVIVWEVLGIDTAHGAHLTISALAQSFRSLNAALLLVWLLVGLGYCAARARAPVPKSSDYAVRDGSQNAFTCLPALVVHPHEIVLPALLLPNNRAVGVGFWVGVVAAFVVLDIVARRSRGRVASGEEFIRFISGPRLANLLLVAAWTYAGWHLFAH
jgi:hypothetical protein